MAQVVPEIRRLKNKYDFMWEQKSPLGYLKICAVLQKWIDQGISVNTNYNPEYYDKGEIPMSEMLTHLLLCYKWGLKQLYYCNINDSAGEVNFDLPAEAEEECEGCVL